MTFYLTLWRCIWKICFVWAWHAVSSWMFDVELCELFTWNHFEGTVGLGDLQFQFVRAGTSWLFLMLTSGETCIWKFGKQTVLIEMNWTLFELFLFCCFVFCFPSNVLGVLLGKFSADHLVFFIVILDQVLVETCGSIGLEIFVGACPGCARGVVPPLSCVGLLQLPDRVVLQWFCIFLPLQWALEFSFLEFLLEFASYWSGFLLECSTYSVTIFPTVFLLYFAAFSGLVWWWPGWLLVLLLVS